MFKSFAASLLLHGVVLSLLFMAPIGAGGQKRPRINTVKISASLFQSAPASAPVAASAPEIKKVPKQVKKESPQTQTVSVPLKEESFSADSAEETANGAAQTMESAGGGADGIFHLTELDLIPKALTNSKPRYPQYAYTNRIEGSVTVSFILNPDGVPTDVAVTKADPKNIFEQSAIQAVESWRFSPAKKKGNAVKTRMLVKINFNLDEYTAR